MLFLDLFDDVIIVVVFLLLGEIPKARFSNSKAGLLDD
jgi:hypothetical protein